jgi:LacI family transcriptional regulator
MSIHEVAKLANVSIATVSRTLHNNPRVSPETAARVWQAIRELKYYPNTHARSLASGRSHIVGLIVSDITNPFFPEMVRGFEESASRRGYDTIIASTNYDPSRTATAVRRMIERKVDGVGIMTSEMDQNLIDEMANRDVPMVFLDVAAPSRRISNLRIDYVGGINLAVRHLLELGHRRIGFLSGPFELKSARTRHDAFIECLGGIGIFEDARLVEQGNHRIDGGLAAMQRLLQLDSPPTAVLASNDLTAIGALRGIRNMGLQVPDDISVVGFDDIDLAEFTEPPLTTVRLSRAEIAERALDCLLLNMDFGREGGSEVVIGTNLIVRKSTAPPRRKRRAETGQTITPAKGRARRERAPESIPGGRPAPR